MLTEDGSPSVLFTDEHGQTELMHNQRGALSETIYVYGELLELLLSFYPQPKIINVGLGLGYSEVLCAALSLKYNKDFGVIHSYEKEQALTQYFLDSIALENLIVVESVAKTLEIDPKLIYQKLKLWIKTSQLVIFGALDDHPQTQTLFNGILYDPFSEKMESQFWSEQWLNHFIKEFADPTCILASYAAKGVLNRCLKQNQFFLSKRPGFGGKKQCTLAFRRWTFDHALKLVKTDR